MTNDWQISVAEQDNRRRWQRLPPPALTELSSPVGYRPREETVDAVNVAITLGQPLLITGEPGCGKTTLADWIAFKLGLEKALRFQTRSTAAAKDLFYHFDAVGRFHAAQTGIDSDPRSFITYRAMGEAIMRALGRDKILDFVSPKQRDRYGADAMRSVVLIDEIDKAPRDFPNDVLAELERFSFEIPEIGRELAAPAEYRPIVIITSNAERSLPEAFLRRCVFHHMVFPDDQLLQDIIVSRISSLHRDSGLVRDGIQVIHALRDQRVGLQRPPGVSELLSFLLVLRSKGFGASDRLVGHQTWIDDAMSTLVKASEAQAESRRALQRVAEQRLSK